MRIGITDYVLPPFDFEARAFDDKAKFVYFDAHDEKDLDTRKIETVDALLVWHMPITSKIVSRLKNCKIVVRYGVGYDNIDIEALWKQRIPFCNTPDYGTEEVADTCCAMILNMQRKISHYDSFAKVIDQGWQEHILRPILRSRQTIIGLVGVGRIGTAVVNRLKSFGFKIVAFDPYQSPGHEKAIGYRRVDTLEELLQCADIVSLHCPLNTETKGMVDKKFLSQMKPGASLVNTARGGLVESLDVVEDSLRSHNLAQAAFDVLPDEPPSDHSLIKSWRENDPSIAGRLVISPHTAYYSEQAWVEMRYKAAETASIFLRNGKIRNLVTPSHADG